MVALRAVPKRNFSLPIDPPVEHLNGPDTDRFSSIVPTLSALLRNLEATGWGRASTEATRTGWLAGSTQHMNPCQSICFRNLGEKLRTFEGTLNLVVSSRSRRCQITLATSLFQIS